MATKTDFNISPYFDDYLESKRFHKVLFRPGFAVQARELTQIQSILQNQIKRFGDHIFKDGAQVIPGEIQYINTYHFVKLSAFSTSNVSDLIGTIFTGDTNGVVAEVINATAATDTEAATLFVNYTKTASTGASAGVINRFVSTETLTGDGGETATVGTNGVALPIDSNAVGTGSAVRVEAGIYYVNGFFVQNEAQTLVLEPYFVNPSFKVGFTITESLITPSDDTTLNDNAQGSSNVNAPGAHRFKITLTLAKKELTSTEDDDFIELLRVDNGNLITKVIKTDYSLIADTLARRTFDESGNYVVRNFDIDVREHHFDSTLSQFERGIYRPDTTKVGSVSDPRYEFDLTADESKARLAIGLGSGKAYVQGYELETIATKYVTIDKSRDFKTVNNSTTGLALGNFVEVSNIYGSPDVDTVSGDTEAYKEVSLYKEATSSRGSANSGVGTDIHQIGVAHPRFFEYNSGTVGASSSNTTSNYKLGLFNITAFTHLRTKLAHSLTTGETITNETGASGIVEAASTSVTAAISNMVSSSPNTLTVTTSSAHNLSTGQNITFDSVGGMTEVNGNTYEIVVTGASEFTIDIDASGFSSYTSGGTAQNGIVVISNKSGTFTAGDTITGATSSNTAVITTDTNYFKSVIEYDFKNVKQIYQANTPAFTADTVLTSNATSSTDDSQYTLTGTISVANSSADVIGQGTKFTTELISGDTIVFTDNTGEELTATVLAIVSDTSLTLSAAVGSADVTTASPVERRRTKLNQTTNNTLVYRLPEKVIKTLKTATNNGLTDTSFTVRRQFVTTLTGDGIGIFNAGSNETFASLSSGDYALMHITAGSSAGEVGEITSLSGTNHEGDTIFSLSGDSDQLTIDLGSNYGNSEVKFTATIVRNVAGEKSKTLVSGATTSITTEATATNSIISLGKADIYQLNSVYMSPDFLTAATTSHTDITDRFDLDNGQRDNFYDLGRLKLKSGAQVPTGQLLINFDYFTHGAGDYFSVDSYAIDYTNIPTFKSENKEETLELRECVDFRPRVADDSNVIGYNDKDATGAKNFTSTNAVSVDIPKPGSNFRADFEFYLSRIDAIYMTTNGQFKQARGASAVDPQRPDTIDNSIILCYLRLPAYTFSTSDVTVIPVDNRRYTMRDIGKLESRIKNLEYYTSLSLLEQETLNLEIQDANGFNRFKNGFLVDTFKGHNVGDTTNSDYQCSMDLENGVVRPRCFTDQVPLTETATNDTARTTAGYQKTGDLITLPYTEVELVSNLSATTTVNVNPFNVFTYVGNMKLTPEFDEWKDTKTSPDLVVNNDLLYNSIKDIPNPSHRTGTVWNEWQNNWTGTFIEKTSSGNQTTVKEGRTGSATRSGLKRELSSQVVQQSFGERLVDLSYVPYIRSKTISFTVTGLKPLSKHYAYFEEVSVDAYVTNTEGTLGGQLTSDANGSLSGTFAIPDPSVSGNPKWRCGERVFKITDSQSNFRTGRNNESFASTKYRAQGLLVTEQETVYATRVPEVMETKLLEENSLREITSTTTYSSGGSSSGSNRGTDNNDSGGWEDKDRDGIPDKRDPDDNDPNVRTYSDLRQRNEDRAKSAQATKDNQSGYGGSCFIAGTKVLMADGTLKNIEDVKVGDKVKGYKGDNIVTRLDPTLLADRKLYSFNNNEHYFFTSEHPFMTEEGWKSIKPEKTKERDGVELYKQLKGELKVGDKLITQNDPIEITSINSKVINNPQLPLYNFNVSNDNSYIADGYVVHNKGCFIKGTLIKMADGTTKPVEQIDIGDVVAVGGFVFATGKFLIDNLYEYKGIKVSGSHMVQEDGQWTRVADSKYAVSLGSDDHIVYVFGSENRRILIDDVLFTDYFELTEQEKLLEKGDNYFENWKEEASKIAELEDKRSVEIMNQKYGE